LVWGAGDRFFKLAYGQALCAAFADCRLVEIEHGRTFIPHDEPVRLANEIAAFQSQPA
jgi:pimeloyl-ACP methyl ester carboxylesterase